MQAGVGVVERGIATREEDGEVDRGENPSKRWELAARDGHDGGKRESTGDGGTAVGKVEELEEDDISGDEIGGQRPRDRVPPPMLDIVGSALAPLGGRPDFVSQGRAYQDLSPFLEHTPLSERVVGRSLLSDTADAVTRRRHPTPSGVAALSHGGGRGGGDEGDRQREGDGVNGELYGIDDGAVCTSPPSVQRSGMRSSLVVQSSATGDDTFDPFLRELERWGVVYHCIQATTSELSGPVLSMTLMRTMTMYIAAAAGFGALFMATPAYHWAYAFGCVVNVIATTLRLVQLQTFNAASKRITRTLVEIRLRFGRGRRTASVVSHFIHATRIWPLSAEPCGLRVTPRVLGALVTAFLAFCFAILQLWVVGESE
jgi:hypothetical protein